MARTNRHSGQTERTPGKPVCGEPLNPNSPPRLHGLQPRLNPLNQNDNRCAANGELSKPRLSQSRVRLRNLSSPAPGRFLLTPSFHSQKTSRYFAGNYPLRAHNGIVIETFISANVRRAHANLPTPSATHRAAKSNGNEPLQRSSIKSNLWRQPSSASLRKKDLYPKRRDNRGQGVASVSLTVSRGKSARELRAVRRPHAERTRRAGIPAR